MFTYTNMLITGVIVAIFLVPTISIAISTLDGLGLGRSDRYEPTVGIAFSLLFTLGIIPAIILNYQYTSGAVLIYTYAIVGTYCFFSYLTAILGYYGSVIVISLNRVILIYNGFTLATVLPQT